MHMLTYLKYSLFLIVLLGLPGCYPGAISLEPVAAHAAKPQFSEDWLYLRQLKRSQAPINMEKREREFTIAALAIRQTKDGYELRHPDQQQASRINVTPMTFHAPLPNPEFLVAATKFKTGTGDIYFVNFMRKVGLTLELIPMDQEFIKKWQPTTRNGTLAKRYLLSLEMDGSTPLIRTELDLETAMLAASLLPKEWRTTYILQKEPPAADNQVRKKQPKPASDNWKLGSHTDPITKSVTKYANLKADKVEPSATVWFQFRCNRGSFQVLAVNSKRPFRNETADTKISLGLLEMRVDDKESHKLVWQIASDNTDLMLDPAGAGGLWKFATVLNPKMSDGNTTWSSVWFLNTMANAKSVLVRVTDISGNTYLATFAPRLTIRKIIDHLPECLNVK